MFSFKQLKYGVITAIFGLIPVTFVIILFELFIDISPYNHQINLLNVSQNYDIKMLVYYIVSGLSHIIICGIIVGHFFLKSGENAPTFKLKSIQKVRFSLLIIMILLVYFLDKFHFNLAYLSHDRLYILMEKSDFFINILKVFPRDVLHFVDLDLFYTFSLFPFVLICTALAVMIFGSFFIGGKLYEYIDLKELSINDIKVYILNMKLIFKRYTQLLSFVLVSSTIATILFFLVPVSLLENPIEKSNYMGVSIAMGVCWGVVFSLTLLFLCIYPYALIHKKIKTVIQQNRIKDDPELEKWIYEYTSYYSLMVDNTFIISIVSPAVSSIFSAIISGTIM